MRATVDGCSESLKGDRLKILEELWKSFRRENQAWRQKSRINWLTEGDKNTNFFQNMANGRRRRNFITNISFQGVNISNPIILRSNIFSFFENHFQKESWQRPKMALPNLKRLSQLQSQGLEEEFSLEEVWRVVSCCDGNKAPGSNGINLNFFKVHWDVIQSDFMNFINEFYKDKGVVQVLNRAFIALIPKVDNLQTMSNFRPISLVSSMYNVLAKVLANRVKLVMVRSFESPRWLLSRIVRFLTVWLLLKR
ncbi:hypothetical protein Ddye_007272 [Dipteronia dyeriana]|uniref:Reverse transcriptase n=1 Tax=Dipteronia dyeriana TaxID=168575 RepID=A0AAD9XJS8_9ROSI|nr:hypothetical protein Ddye_007272 [Dipteronia dyeriana]